MRGNRTIDRIGLAAIALALCITVGMMAAPAAVAETPQVENSLGYEDKLFDTEKVHTIDILIDDWEGFVQTCQSEEYSLCSVVIDGETVHNVGIRGKGNTSLSNVASMDSDRYSFKIEFDQYDDSISYHGLDKLSLNNLIQDNTMMKDYLTYRLMNEFGVAAPLCSFAYLTVNGEDWGLYLAVEAVEDSFLARNYGTDHGDLYKPDSTQMGGGRGYGREFDMDDFMENMQEGTQPDDASGMGVPNGGGGRGGGAGPDVPQAGGAQRGMGGMGSSEVKLQYTDDEPSSYSTIFDSAKTIVTQADEQRLIAALKTLGGENASDAVDVQRVLRYFVVHNYVVNGDSYTGSMVHNYYLYEEDGRLSMIPWDYNLAFGTFQGNDAASAVNDDIDYPLSVTGSDRPMADWIIKDADALAQYHQLFAQFLDEVDVQSILSHAEVLIAPYVEKDPTKFCTTEAFIAGVDTLKTFCVLRTQSVVQQLAGNKAPVDPAGLDLSLMGTMGNGFDRGGQMQRPDAMQQNVNTQPAPDAFEPSGRNDFAPEGIPADLPSDAMGDFDPQRMQPQGGRMEKPDGGRMQGFAQNAPAGFAEQNPAAEEKSGGAAPMLLSAAVLAAALIFAITYRRR